MLVPPAVALAILAVGAVSLWTDFAAADREAVVAVLTPPRIGPGAVRLGAPRSRSSAIAFRDGRGAVAEGSAWSQGILRTVAPRERPSCSCWPTR
jgi:hypothetical protein